MADEPEDDKPQPPTEAQLEQEADPDQAVFAEQAIHSYATWALDQFRESLTSTLDNFGNWVMSQGDAEMFDNGAFFESVGQVALGQIMELFGGSATPIGQAVYRMVGGSLDQAVRQEAEASLFVAELSRTARDACWYLRDNLSGILANQWDQLRDLAYEGSSEFIPVLHQLGLPLAELDTATLQSSMVGEAERYRASVPREQEAATKDVDGAKEADPKAEENQKTFDDEEGQKQAV